MIDHGHPPCHGQRCGAPSLRLGDVFCAGYAWKCFFFLRGGAAERRCYTEKFHRKSCQRCERHIYAEDGYAGTMGEDLDDDPPFDFDKWLSSKDPSEQERLNLIVMKYFDLNNDIFDPVESNYHLEAIAAEYDLMQHGEDTKFIQWMNEGSVELGRVGAYDKPIEELKVGDLDTMYGVPIMYDPDDRADLEMKYTSSDVFEIAFDHIAKANEGGRPMDNRLAPEWMKVEDPPYVGDDEITGVGMNEIPPQGNDCCEDLRTELIRLNHKYHGTTAELLFDDMEFMQDEDCADLEDALDDLTQYAEELLSFYIDPDAKAMLHRMNPTPFVAIKECLDELRQAKLEYDSCKGNQFGDVNHLDFTASEDPFEIAWDMVMKAPLDLDSIKPFMYSAEDAENDKRMHVADFVDPNDQQRYPMVISTPSYSHDFNVDIDYPPDQDSGFDPNIGRKIATSNVHYRDEDEPIGLDEMRYPPDRSVLGVSPYVSEPYRRKGMGQAIYDLVRELGYRIKPSDHLSDGSEGLWRKNQGREIDDDSEWRGMRERGE